MFGANAATQSKSKINKDWISCTYSGGSSDNFSSLGAFDSIKLQIKFARVCFIGF